MTSFEIISNAFKSIKEEGIEKFKDDIRKVGELFKGIDNTCTEEQKSILSKMLAEVESCTNGLAEESDSSNLLGLGDDELFSVVLFMKVFEQVA